jgi:hypothetical protein
LKHPDESPACELLRDHLRAIYAPRENEPADRQTSSTEGREKSGENAGMAREMLPSKDHAKVFS